MNQKFRESSRSIFFSPCCDIIATESFKLGNLLERGMLGNVEVLTLNKYLMPLCKHCTCIMAYYMHLLL